MGNFLDSSGLSRVWTKIASTYLPITSTKITQVRYLNFRNSRSETTEISGYVGCGSSGDDSIYLAAYSGYNLFLGGDKVAISSGGLYFGGVSSSYYITTGGQANLATCYVAGSAVLTAGNYSTTLGSIYHPRGGGNMLDLQAKSLSVYADAGDGEGISLYRSTSFIQDYGIMFAHTSTFGTLGSTAGAWATYFNSTGYGWIFRCKDTGNAASISYQGHLDLTGQIRFSYNDNNSTIGRRYSANDSNCYNYIKFYQGLNNTDNSTAGIEYYAGRDTSGVVSAHRFMVTSSNSIALDIRNSGHIGIGKISDRNYTVEVNGSLNATSLCQSGYSVYTTGNLSPVTTDTNQVINSIKSTPYVYFYSYASESTPIGYVGRGSTGSNSIQLSCYYDNISIAAAGDVYLSSHSNTNLTLKDNYHTYVLTGNYNTMPSLGALGVRTFAIRPSTGTSDYGLYMWSLQQTGGGYLQCGYNDGTTNALNLFLQPLGGGVAIGGYGTSPSYTLDLFGNLARMRYLYFTNTSNDGVCGYVGRGGNGNDVELQSYSGSLYLGGYSQNQIVLGSGVQNIGIGTVDPHGCITLGGETKFHYSCAAKLGQAYSSGDYNLYNWIQFYGGGGGIVFVSGVWTSGDVDAFKFCGGGGTSDVIFYMASRGQAVMYRQFYVQDNIIATGAITAGSASDVRLKQNIQLLNKDKAKSIILNSRPVEFTWSSEATSLYDKLVGDDIGLVAQEIEPYLPQAIGEIFNKYKRLDYTKLITPLISVVQDHEESIADLKERVRMLEKENKELKEKLK